MSEYRRPSSVGINIHPSKNADQITATIAYAIVGLRGLAETTADPEWAELADRFAEPLPRANRKMQKLYERMRTLQMVSPETFRSAREGDIPWPEQKGLAANWVPPCRCHDRCGVHSFDRDEAKALEAGWVCSCGQMCLQHSRPSGYRVRQESEGEDG